MCKCTPGHEVHPQPKQESIFRQVYAGWLRLDVYLDAILRVTTKKKVFYFFWEKVHPPRQNPGYAYAQNLSLSNHFLSNCFWFSSVHHV